MEKIPHSFGNVSRCIARRPWRGGIFFSPSPFSFPHFFPFSLPDVGGDYGGGSHWKLISEPPSLLFLVLFWGLCYESCICCAALLFHQPPTRVSSIIIIVIIIIGEEEDEEEGTCSPRYLVALPRALLFQPSSDRFFVASRCPSLTFQIGLGLQRLLCMDRQRSPLGLYTTRDPTGSSWKPLLSSPRIYLSLSWVRILLIYTDTLSILVKSREPNEHEK